MFNSKWLSLTLAFATLQNCILADEEKAEKGRIAPTAVFLDLADQCPHTEWTDWISNAIDNRGVVKCVQIGDGFWSSFFDPLDH